MGRDLPRHPTATVQYYPPNSHQLSTIEVDIEVLPFVRLLWAKKITTQYSCQGNKRASNKSIAGWGYVMVDTPDYPKLLELLNIPHDVQQQVANPDELGNFLGKNSIKLKKARTARISEISHQILMVVELNHPVIRFRNTDISKLICLLNRLKPRFNWVSTPTN